MARIHKEVRLSKNNYGATEHKYLKYSPSRDEDCFCDDIRYIPKCLKDISEAYMVRISIK